MFENILEEFKRIKGDGKIVLFGSLSKGNAGFSSDIDIAVISDDKKFIGRTESIADSVLLDYGRVVSVIKFSTKEFNSGREPVIKEIMKGEG